LINHPTAVVVGVVVVTKVAAVVVVAVVEARVVDPVLEAVEAWVGQG